MDGDGKMKLFVGQIPREWDVNKLSDIFSRYGPITDISILRDPLNNNISKGCAFVTMASKEDGERAISELHDIYGPSDGRRMQVRDAADKKMHIPTGRLYIKNLGPTTKGDNMMTMLADYGRVLSVTVQYGPGGVSKCTCLAEMESIEAAHRAVQNLNGICTIPGASSPLLMEWAHSNAQRHRPTPQVPFASAYPSVPPPAQLHRPSYPRHMLPFQQQQEQTSHAYTTAAYIQQQQHQGSMGFSLGPTQTMYPSTSLETAGAMYASPTAAGSIGFFPASPQGISMGYPDFYAAQQQHGQIYLDPYHHLQQPKQPDPQYLQHQHMQEEGVEQKTDDALVSGQGRERTEQSVAAAGMNNSYQIPPPTPTATSMYDFAHHIASQQQQPQPSYLFQFVHVNQLAPQYSPVVFSPKKSFARHRSSSSMASSPSSSFRYREGPADANLFVKGFPLHWTAADLNVLFQQFGDILSSSVYIDRNTRLSRGFGFVSYGTSDQARLAIENLHGQLIQVDADSPPFKLRVEPKLKRTDSEQQMMMATSSFQSMASAAEQPLLTAASSMASIPETCNTESKPRKQVLTSAASMAEMGVTEVTEENLEEEEIQEDDRYLTKATHHDYNSPPPSETNKNNLT